MIEDKKESYDRDGKHPLEVHATGEFIIVTKCTMHWLTTTLATVVRQAV